MLKTLEKINFNNRFATLPEDFFARVKLISFNNELAKSIGHVLEECQRPEFCPVSHRQTPELIAHRPAVGFAHGVMNTDNMSVLELRLAYGTNGFVEACDPGIICHHSEHCRD